MVVRLGSLIPVGSLGGDLWESLEILGCLGISVGGPCRSGIALESDDAAPTYECCVVAPISNKGFNFSNENEQISIESKSMKIRVIAGIGSSAADDFVGFKVDLSAEDFVYAREFCCR